MTMKHQITSLDGVDSIIVVLHDGEIYQALVNIHPSFPLILESLRKDPQDDSVIALFDVERALRAEFQRVSPRITIQGGKVLFDGDVLHNGVEKQILRFVDEGEADRLQAVVNFTEKVMTNPNEHSRNQLFNWLDRYDFTITDEGDIVGYKGCADGPEGPTSKHSAPESDRVTRNDKPVTGYVLNLPGDVIEMPRSIVQHDPSVGCHKGLHIGTFAYANQFKGYNGILLEVHFNPRDVVSVPTDSGEQKIRACRYTVVDMVEEQYKTAVLPRKQVSEPVIEKADTEFVDDREVVLVRDGVTYRVGDKVKTVNEVTNYVGHRQLNVPIGSLATITRKSNYGGYEVEWDNADNGKGRAWNPDRFELAKPEVKAADTRDNYKAQKRYPAGTYKGGKSVAGRFIPKDSPDYNRY